MKKNMEKIIIYLIIKNILIVTNISKEIIMKLMFLPYTQIIKYINLINIMKKIIQNQMIII